MKRSVKRSQCRGLFKCSKNFPKRNKGIKPYWKSCLKKGAAKGLDDYKFKWITDIKRSDYAVDVKYSKGMNYSDLLMLAMKQEEKALALYNKLLEEAHTDDSKKLFKMLCQEEAKHKLSLETLYDDYMARMGG